MTSLVAMVRGWRELAPASPPWGAWGLRSLAFLYIAIMIVVPSSAVVREGLGDGLDAFWRDLNRFGAKEALILTLWTAMVMTVINVVMGTLTAYVLVRYEFPGKAVLNAVIDLPLAIPTLVTGVVIVILLGPQGMVGGWFDDQGFEIVFSWPAIIIALLFVTLPITVRAVQPVLEVVEVDQEEAAYTLGASAWQTFWRVLVPALLPAIISGALLTFARALGEFGSIVVVAGNNPGGSLTAPVHIFAEIESGHPRGASAMSIVLLAIWFTLIIALDWVQTRRAGKRNETIL